MCFELTFSKFFLLFFLSTVYFISINIDILRYIHIYTNIIGKDKLQKLTAYRKKSNNFS